MFRRFLIWIGISLAAVGTLPAAAPQNASIAPQPASQYRAGLDRYRVTCHNERLRTAGLVLSTMDVGNPGTGAEVWETVVRKLRTETMPPAGLPRPEKATYNSFAIYLETELDRAAAARPNPGEPVIRRLNRT